MCGINGFVDRQKKMGEVELKRFNQAIKHRGPDDEGVFLADSSSAKIGLGHVRLSVLDLSPLGHQPMHFEHLHIVLNGEIYNFQEVRKDLQRLGYNFISQ